MKSKLNLLFLAAAGLISGCQSLPPGAEPGPDGTMAYTVSVEASPPGAQIEVNGSVVGKTPLQLKIFGDRDGTFHDFGSEFYVIRALPVSTNQFAQVHYYGTGRFFGPEDRIPDHIYFDMNRQMPSYPPPVDPDRVYVHPGYWPPPPYYYGPPYFYGPGIHFYYGPRYYPHRHWR